MKDIYIIGFGGLGKETSWVIQRINQVKPIWNCLGFIDDDLSYFGEDFNGVPVLGGLNTMIDKTDHSSYIIAIASPVIRKKIAERLKQNNHLHPASIIDPSVIMSDTADIGDGVLILPGCIITVNVKLDDYVIINYATTIGHDSQIGSFSTVYPGAHIAGNVTLGTGCQVGTGAVILQGLTVGSDTFVGGQAVVINSIDEQGTYVGVPVHKLPPKIDE